MLSRFLHDGSCVDLLVACVEHGLSGRFCVEHDDLVAKNGVLVGLDDACDDVFAVCLQIRNERSDIAVAVNEEETVNVGELSKSCRVDNLTKVEFAFSLLGKCGKCVVAVFLDELAVVFGTFCGISVEFAPAISPMRESSSSADSNTLNGTLTLSISARTTYFLLAAIIFFSSFKSQKADL